MKHVTAILVALLSVFVANPTSAVAQDAQPATAVSATLTTDNLTANSGETIKLMLTVSVKADCKISTTLLTGHRVEAYIEDSLRHTFESKKDGMVDVIAGTSFSRPIPIDLKLALGGDVSSEGMKSITFRWPGFEGAETRVTVVPDQSGIDLDKLDYTKTKVRMVTSAGDIMIGFRPDKAPNHVRNFVKLSRDGFYNGTQFHRVISGFMAQGGCPNTKKGATGRPGTGDPGYKIDAEFNDIKHVRGIVSAARGADPNSAGSQFFLMHAEAPHLDGQYTAYGQIEEGFETLDKIATAPCAGPQRSTPVEEQHLHAAIVLPVYK